jgi:hypothetical protein
VLCRDAEFVEESADAALDVVADGPHVVDGLARGVVQATTSAARTISSVQGLANSRVMSMPRSLIAATAAGLTSYPGSEPPDQATAPVRGGGTSAVSVSHRSGGPGQPSRSPL